VKKEAVSSEAIPKKKNDPTRAATCFNVPKGGTQGLDEHCLLPWSPLFGIFKYED
jgi:hypothetical protein